MTRKKVPKGLKRLPCEKGLPLVGVLFNTKNGFHFYLKRLGEKYGPLFAIKLGMRESVVLNNYDVIKKALKDNGDIFSGRFEIRHRGLLCHQSGIILQDGDLWAKQKTFILSVFRDLGIGKSNSIEIIQSEWDKLFENLIASEEKAVVSYNILTFHTANIILKFIMNKRFTKGSETLSLIESLMKKTIHSQLTSELLPFLFPVLDRFVLYPKLVDIFTNDSQMFRKAFAFFQEEIKERLKTLNLNSEGEDFMEKFLIKQHEMMEKMGSVDTFSEWQLISSSYDLFIGGFETTASLMEWSWMFMSRFPEIQEKVYKEIEDKVGIERIVTMNDKVSLTYTQAVMDEIMRMSSVVPHAVLHRTMKDTSLDGYFIPENTFVYSHLFACHYDADIWDDPKQFNPGRFLTTGSDEQLTYTPKKELIPFGMGKRVCIAEALARVEYFIFFTNILQKFRISTPENITDERYDQILRLDGFIVRSCLEKRFIFKLRHQIV